MARCMESNINGTYLAAEVKNDGDQILPCLSAYSLLEKVPRTWGNLGLHHKTDFVFKSYRFKKRILVSQEKSQYPETVIFGLDHRRLESFHPENWVSGLSSSPMLIEPRLDSYVIRSSLNACRRFPNIPTPSRRTLTSQNNSSANDWSWSGSETAFCSWLSQIG